MKAKHAQRMKRHLKIRKKVFGSENRPRLTVFRSNKYIYAQLINDSSAKTIFGSTDKTKNPKSEKRITSAKSLGLSLAEKAIAKKIKEIVFDRGGYKYHGRIKAVAEGLREGGLKF